MSEFFMDYIIFFKDDTEYQNAVNFVGSNFYRATPRAAASQFNIPYPYPTGNINSIPKGIYFIYPYIPGQPVKLPNFIGQTYNDNFPSTIYPAQPGNPDGAFFEKVPNVTLSWVGNIVKSLAPKQVTVIPKRRWIGGKELAGILEGGSGIDYNNFCRDFSRTIDGYGFGIRGVSSFAVWNRKIDEYRVGLTTPYSWERFYVRLRNLPSISDTGLWRTHGTTTGIGLKLKTTGEISLFGINASNVATERGVVLTPIVNEWNRVDILLKYGSAGIAKIYINGTLKLSYTDSTANDLGANNLHISSDMGQWTSPLDIEVEVDFDDWINSDLPANLNLTTLDFNDTKYPVDWLAGSHVKSHFGIRPFQRITTQPGDSDCWFNPRQEMRVANAFPAPVLRLGTLEFYTNVPFAGFVSMSDVQDTTARDNAITPMGASAGVVGYVGRDNQGVDGAVLGYIKEYGISTVLAGSKALNQDPVDAAASSAYLPEGLTTPGNISIWESYYARQDTDSFSTISMLLSAIEYLGYWNKEDNSAFNFAISRLTNIHNCRWNNTAWGYLGGKPLPDVFAVSNTYAGNGTYQEINLPGPCHFLWIRQLTGSVATLGARFFGASNGVHYGCFDTFISGSRVWYDAYGNQYKPTPNQYKFSVSGNELNATDASYQYVAFCDPGMRYNLCGAFRHGSSSSVPKINPLIVPDFTPEAAFIQLDKIANVSSYDPPNIEGLWYRDTQYTGHKAVGLATNVVLDEVATFGAGLINSYAGIHKDAGPINYSLWRTQDGGNGTNVMVQLTTYIGDGTANRDIILTPTSGRYPLFVLITSGSHNVPAYMRDSGHVGNSSTAVVGGTYQADAIKSLGIDKITVGVNSNIVGVTYSVFSICGGLTNANGTYYPTYHNSSNIAPYVLPTYPIILNKSGIYFVNPNKAALHDSYYDRTELKIPDPIVRTALFGD